MVAQGISQNTLPVHCAQALLSSTSVVPIHWLWKCTTVARALAADPWSNKARLGLVAVFLASGREEEASTLVADLLETAAGARRVDALILQAEVETGRGRVGEARRALALAVELDDDRYDAHQRLR